MKRNIMDNHQQWQIYQQIYTEVTKTAKNLFYTPKNSCFFIDGPAGTGKSYLLNGLIKNLRAEGYSVLTHATTGIAAQLLEDGQTVHSRFKLPLFLDQQTELNIKP